MPRFFGPPLAFSCFVPQNIQKAPSGASFLHLRQIMAGPQLQHRQARKGPRRWSDPLPHSRHERMKMNHSGMSRFTAKMLVKRQNDRLFGTFKFPAEHALRAYLDTLTDDNLLDLALLYYMAETNDVTLSVEPGEPRLTCLAVLPSHSAFMVSVRQARVLPPSSFRFRLAADTLDFG